MWTAKHDNIGHKISRASEQFVRPLTRNLTHLRMWGGGGEREASLPFLFVQDFDY